MKKHADVIVSLLDKYNFPYEIVYSNYVGRIIYEDKKCHCGYGHKLVDFCKEKVYELGASKIKLGYMEWNNN